MVSASVSLIIACNFKSFGLIDLTVTINYCDS